jgi:hypothetical protein
MFEKNQIQRTTNLGTYFKNFKKLLGLMKKLTKTKKFSRWLFDLIFFKKPWLYIIIKYILDFFYLWFIKFDTQHGLVQFLIPTPL